MQDPTTQTAQSPLASLIREIATVEYFDSRYYKFTFASSATRWIASVTKKLEEYREKGIENFRETVGAEEANRALEEGGEWGGIVHHGCFLIATGGAVLYEPPAYQSVGIANKEVDELRKQNASYREQLDKINRPHLTISDQYRFVQVMKFKYWFDTVQPEVLFAETRVYSLDDDIAGRIDFLFRVSGGAYPLHGTLSVQPDSSLKLTRAKDVVLPEGIVLPDVKSGTWSNKYWLQMGAYARAVEVSLGQQVLATVAIRLKSTNMMGMITDVHSAGEIVTDLTNFKHISAIYDLKHANDEPFDMRFNSILYSVFANPAVPLGAIMPNPTDETKVAEEEVKKLNEAQAETLEGTTPSETANGAGVPVETLGGDDTGKKAPAPEASNGELALGPEVQKRYAGRRKKTNGNT
jgi:hypothetical protein